MGEFDTICAIASAMTNSGIGIIRVSGDDAIEKVDNIFQGKNKLSDMDSHTVSYGHIVFKDKIIDEVMVLVLRAPRTYTRENTIEIDCHGGIIVMQQILKAVIAQGVRPADPGEFTKRAFLNGRIDLSQAESVMDIIDSKSALSLENSKNQLFGLLSKKIKSLRESIIYEIAFIESALDDPEHISLDGYEDRLLEKVKIIENDLKKMIDSADNGSMVRDGIKTSIIGKPNAGKSSLLNLLSKKDRAIVTDIAGTTRDTLEEQIMLRGISLIIMDTAGIRETEDVVEAIGVKKAIDTIDDSDLILYVVDSSTKLDENDKHIIEKIKDSNVIVLLNKSDLNSLVTEEEISDMVNGPVITFSAKNGDGLDILEDKIDEMFFSGILSDDHEIYITNARHLNALTNAYNSMANVKYSIEMSMPEDFLSIDLMEAYTQLGYIIGESIDDDLMDEIFSKFCTGK
ncbi:MAG: tRNA uridine-5-carboxymethylaminomethyl(34) synthesis GTPase MnmE [Lachnospiraceae bacterium]|nr:tRNA uridine-5-carboxymethylaminomethyl(34) synthesis GTPase MnmE [Lachnospiraceae bacterium]